MGYHGILSKKGLYQGILISRIKVEKLKSLEESLYQKKIIEKIIALIKKGNPDIIEEYVRKILKYKMPSEELMN